MIGNDLLGDPAPPITALELQQQAFPQIPRAHARRIQALHRFQRSFQLFRRAILRFADLLQRGAVPEHLGS